MGVNVSIASPELSHHQAIGSTPCATLGCLRRAFPSEPDSYLYAGGNLAVHGVHRVESDRGVREIVRSRGVRPLHRIKVSEAGQIINPPGLGAYEPQMRLAALNQINKQRCSSRH